MLWETIVGRNPKQAVIENLRHFKALAETGEIPRTQGQPHGPARIDRRGQEIDVWRGDHHAARVESESELTMVFEFILIINESSELESCHESALLDGKQQGGGSQR